MNRIVPPQRANNRIIALCAAMILCTGLLTVGCEAPGRRLPPDQEVALESRALDLLTRAAESELDVLRANAMEALVKVDPEMGRPHFRAALEVTTPLVRYAGCIASGDVRDRNSLPILRRLLEEPDARVRMAAAYAVYRCGETGAGRILLDNLTDNPDEKMRAEAAYLIGKLGDRKATRALQKAEPQETSSYVVVHIQTALALLGEIRMVDRLIEYMLKSDSVTRLLALQGLVELRDDRARRALAYRVSDESDYLETRLLAARGLGKLGDPSGYRLAYAALGYRAKGKQDEHDQMRVRVNAALALGSIGDRKALGALRDLAEGEADERVQVAAAMAILQIVRADQPLRQ